MGIDLDPSSLESTPVLEIARRSVIEALSGGRNLAAKDALPLHLAYGECIALTAPAKAGLIAALKQQVEKARAARELKLRNKREKSRDFTPLEDDSFNKGARDVIVHKCIQDPDAVFSIPCDSVYRLGTRHSMPGICDYCDLIGRIAEFVGQQYKDVYNVFGGDYGHVAVLGGRDSMGRGALPGASAKFSFAEFGFDYKMANVVIRPQKQATFKPMPLQIREHATRQDIAFVSENGLERPISPGVADDTAPAAVRPPVSPTYRARSVTPEPAPIAEPSVSLARGGSPSAFTRVTRREPERATFRSPPAKRKKTPSPPELPVDDHAVSAEPYWLKCDRIPSFDE
jgi:hypothetical protein